MSILLYDSVEDRLLLVIRYTCLNNFGASEAVNLCRYGKKSTKLLN